MKRTNKKGFTLIELLIVVAIMAIIAAVAVPAIMGAADQGTADAEKADRGNCLQAVNNTVQTIKLDITNKGGLYTDGVTADNFAKALNASYHPENIDYIILYADELVANKTMGNYKVYIHFDGADAPANDAAAEAAAVACNDLQWVVAAGTGDAAGKERAGLVADTGLKFTCTSGTWAAPVLA